MEKKKKAEKTTARVRIFPSTHKRLKMIAAKSEMTMAEVVDELSKSVGI